MISVRAPATTANLGPGFDCAALALDLWDELEVSEGLGVEVSGEGAGEIPESADHLGVRAFALLASPEGRRFRFVNRIPLERGLGSSAATIALGLTAGALAAGRALEPEEALALGFPLEGHADNLAAALAGGVCLAWLSDGSRRIARLAGGLPLATLALVPEGRVKTSEARGALPQNVSHLDASFTTARAALLGAGLACGSAELLAAAFADLLHEPYRAASAPLLEAVRSRLPQGAVGVTLSGSGPSVIVWTRPEATEACAAELRGRFPEARVIPLAVSPTGAHAL